MHRSSGVCKVNEIKVLSICGNPAKEYYELLSVYKKGSKVTTPVDNNDGRIRDITSEEEANNLLDDLKNIEVITIKNNRAFQETVRKIVAQFNPVGLAQIVKTVYMRKKKKTYRW